MSKFLTPLIVEEIDDQRWALTSDLLYQSDIFAGEIHVPIGFITDGPSVPRLPFIYWIWGDRAKEPAVVHDWLYAWQGTTREVADKILLEACGACGIPGWISNTYFWGVRIGGWKAWGEDKIKEAKWRIVLS